MRAIPCIKNFFDLSRSPVFAKYEKDFASAIQEALYRGYREHDYEPDLVALVERMINSVRGLNASTRGVDVSTNAIFIHGSKSHVNFKYFEDEVQRELGDLIFVVSVIFNGRKYFEKMTICQFKKDDRNLKWSLASDSSQQQLYLLSRFPTFKGAGNGSLVPMRDFNLRNYSGCLGSYGLFYTPGDFAFTSATRFAMFLGDRKSVNLTNLLSLQEETRDYNLHLPYIGPVHPLDFEEFFHEWERHWRKYYYKADFPFPPFPYFGFPHNNEVLGNVHFSQHVFNFISAYLRANIGELIHSAVGGGNHEVKRFFTEVLRAMEHKAKKESLKEVSHFVDRFFEYGYGGNDNVEDFPPGEFDYRGGGLGIVYTSINLGEGEYRQE